MINCLLVEDQTLVRLGLANLLNLDENICIKGQAEDGIQALELLASQQFDIILLDMRMPNLDGLGVLNALRTNAIPTPVLIITTFEDCDVLVKAINLGARGYVLKNIELEALIDAIQQVIAGKKVLQSALTTYLLDQQLAPQEKLTEKEQAVLRCLSLGMSNKIIANTLHNSEGTIRNHVSQILAKLEVKDRTQAVIKAINQSLI
ncbi:response regulator transcription factor [Pseudoalteromonas piscicida]|jgi:DNA-binding NarL/FixJ family response regulator|uniref:response regulator n=1 Tax=Pseudoalteromonas TaxID=53246 RepID=UPI00029B1C3B|nr:MULTISPECIES: response regulator transcription factor [Pseudoalteromonas]MCF2828955.1 response regulator transcription factor [Pseudoalteromonas sp. OF5H-5]MCF2829889.1 response regulator transcription factor [Pseudoalteromonas sp. DL2-H6]MCF2926196.1 response regulator transcription factor [Pseudoalteromonas sp. DL2-H1]MCG7554341.1 response regulator transcription factor [Pseudoalteromonas sp. Of11M-6]NSY35947.1 DNA-binding response regulator [Pseudoalteromonas sp. JC28]